MVKVKGQGQMCMLQRGRYLGLTFFLQQNHHDPWNTVQDLCVFVSNQGAFTIKDPHAAVEGFYMPDHLPDILHIWC